MPKRELSCFLCRELMYEYVVSSIDSRRGDAVARHIGECPECKVEQEGIKSALTYTKKLSLVEIRPEYLSEISNPVPLKTYISSRLKWQSWPDPLKWTVESLAFATTVAIFVGFVGQRFFKGGLVEGTNVAVVEHPTQTINVDQLPDQTPSEFGDEEFTDHENDVEISQVSNATQPTEKRLASPEPDVKVVDARQEPDETTTVDASTDAALVKNQNGFLYRTRLLVSDLDLVTSEIVSKIETLEGKKAGEVPLGWKRPTGSYFHFSMPEKNYGQLAEFLRKYKSPSIVKEKNPRVMPKGLIRMILEVDSSGSDHPTPGEPPQDEPVPTESPPNEQE